MALAWGDGAWGDNAWGGGETFPVSVTETALLVDTPAAGLLIDVSITESLTGGTAWGSDTWGSGYWSGTSGIQEVQTGDLTSNVCASCSVENGRRRVARELRGASRRGRPGARDHKTYEGHTSGRSARRAAPRGGA